MFVGLPGIALALSLGASAHAQEDPVRPVGRCLDVTPRHATPKRATIVFEYASNQLDPASAPAVDALIDAGTKGAQLCVEVHTAVRGDAAENLKLSRARAGSVLAALREGGVGDGRAVGYGRGESEPVDPDDRANARVVVWTWTATSQAGAAPSGATARAPVVQPPEQLAAVSALVGRIPASPTDPEVATAVAALGRTQTATFGDTYERRFPSAGVSLVVGREGGVDRVRLYGRLLDARVGGYAVESPNYMADFSSTWAGPLPADLTWGATTPEVLRQLGDDAVCLWFGTDYQSLVYPSRGLTAVVQPFGTGARADCRGRLAVIEFSAPTDRPGAVVSVAELGAIAGLRVDDRRTEDVLARLGPYLRVGQPPTWVFRQAGVEINSYDGVIRDVAVYGKMPGRPVLSGLWPWEGDVPHGLSWGAAAAEVAGIAGHALTCDPHGRAVGGETRAASVSSTEQALFLLDKVLYEDAAAIRARAPRGSCEGASLVGWRFTAPSE